MEAMKVGGTLKTAKTMVSRRRSAMKMLKMPKMPRLEASIVDVEARERQVVDYEESCVVKHMA